MSQVLSTPPTIGFKRHDHASCIADALATAEARCADEGLRFTPVRRRALEILLEQHRALGAYEMLERLQAEGLGAQPPAAYRALEFLTSHGFAHRIERLNAFVACTHPGMDHIPAFLVCRVCERVAETLSLPFPSVMAETAPASGFEIERIVVEAEGICSGCQSGSSR